MQVNDEDYKKSNWVTEGEPIIPMAMPYQNPIEHTLSFIILSAYKNIQAIIENIYVQGPDGNILDVLLADKWYFNPQQLPEFLTIPLLTNIRPTYILICNGVGNLAVKSIEVKYDGESIWRGDLPIGTEPNSWFPIAVPNLPTTQSGTFQMPTITAFREMDTIHRQ